MPKPPPPESPFWKLFGVATTLNKHVFRLTKGRIGGTFPGTKTRILILHHVGRKSGEPRETPLVYLQDRDDLVIVGSMGGSPKHPAWCLNVRDRPDQVAVEIKGRRFPVRVREASREERDRLWPRLLEVWPAWEDYMRRTHREFPVFILTPA